MAYEIPQELQHKERIIFGLTFVQLGWATLFGGLVLIILLGNGSLTAKFTLAIFPAVLGILFIFFNASEWLTRIFLFFKFRSANLDSNKMKSLIGISKI